eukprot:m51a1_g9265 putative acetaldehyde dehydrogenase (686) ;mRNA; f:71287-74178
MSAQSALTQRHLELQLGADAIASQLIAAAVSCLAACADMDDAEVDLIRARLDSASISHHPDASMVVPEVVYKKRKVNLDDPNALCVLVAIVPETTPDVAVLVLARLAVTSRSSVIFLPHPRSWHVAAGAARMCDEVAHSCGAPEGLVQCAPASVLDPPSPGHASDPNPLALLYSSLHVDAVVAIEAPHVTFVMPESSWSYPMRTTSPAPRRARVVRELAAAVGSMVAAQDHSVVVAELRETEPWLRMPKMVYFGFGSLSEALMREVAGRQKAAVVTDFSLFYLGFTNPVAEALSRVGVPCEVMYNIEKQPDWSTIRRGVERLRVMQPDTIIAIGGGSTMDAAKIIWLFYEHPELEKDLSSVVATTFADVRRRTFATQGRPPRCCPLLCVPTTSGTGSEVSPFAMIINEHESLKHIVADESLIPDVAICAPEFVLSMPRPLVTTTGMDVLSRAIEAYTSIYATPLTDPMCLKAIEFVFKYLLRSHADADDREAREAMHYASTLSGIAFCNNFLGLCHSCSRQLEAEFRIQRGIASSVMLPHVIQFNARSAVMREFYPSPRDRYTAIAQAAKLVGKDAVASLANAVDELKKNLGVPLSIREYGVGESEFMTKVDFMAARAYDEQSTATNPCRAEISDIRSLLLDAFYGPQPIDDDGFTSPSIKRAPKFRLPRRLSSATLYEMKKATM